METQNNNAERSNSPTVLAAKQVIATVFDQYENPRLTNARIIDADSEDLIGLIESLMSDPAKPILFITNQPVPKLIESKPELVRILKFPNTRITRTTHFVAEAADIFDRGRYAIDKDKENNTRESLRSRIRHDLSHALNGSSAHDKNELIKKARTELGLNGDDESIVQFIMDDDTSVEVETFTEINGLFVDWAGTLLDKNYRLDMELFKKLLNKAKSEGLPLVIWTGGDVNGVHELLNLYLEDMDIDWKVNVCSKRDCKGLKVKKAVDDLKLDELRNTYGFDVEEFYDVKEFK